jgi:hypothetical protein
LYQFLKSASNAAVANSREEVISKTLHTFHFVICDPEKLQCQIGLFYKVSTLNKLFKTVHIKVRKVVHSNGNATAGSWTGLIHKPSFFSLLSSQ